MVPVQIKLYYHFLIYLIITFYLINVLFNYEIRLEKRHGFRSRGVEQDEEGGGGVTGRGGGGGW